MTNEQTNKRTKEEGTMLVNKGGQRVARGTYWNPADGHRVDIRSEDGVLPGGSEATYLRMPAAGMIVMAPITGVLYVLTLPVLGLAAFVGMFLMPMLGVVSGAAMAGIKAASGVASHVSFGWAPMAAYLSGKKRSKKK